jgi:predicted methyltransferase
MYQLLFNNLNFNFTQEEFESFQRYMYTLEVEYWEQEFKYSIYNKRIPIPTIQSNLLILLNKAEVLELKRLIEMHQSGHELIKASDINYQWQPN